MPTPFLDTLRDYILSGHAYLSVPTPEPARFLAELRKLAGELPPEGRPVFYADSSSAPDQPGAHQRFRVTHPFHPLVGSEFEAVTVRDNWGENRVHFHDERGRLRSIPTPWTSLAAEDPFVAVGSGRTCLRVADLIRLVAIVERLQGEAR